MSMQAILRWVLLLALTATAVTSVGCNKDKGINEAHDKALEEEGEK